MRRAIALASATAAWVLMIQVASIAMAPPIIVELSPVDVSRSTDSTTSEQPLEFTLAPSNPALIVVPVGTLSPTTTTAGTSHQSRPLSPPHLLPRWSLLRPPQRRPRLPKLQLPSRPLPPQSSLLSQRRPSSRWSRTTTIAAPATTTTQAPATTTTVASAAGGFSATAELEFASKINGSRSSAGVAGLSANGELNNYARWWARQMAESGNFSHSDFQSLLDPWWLVGENVGYGPTVGAIFDKLVASTLHYTNMVDARFTSVGVGAYVDATGRIWTAHLFGG